MGWITRLLEGADAQRSTTRLAREDAKAERAAEPQAGSDDSPLGLWIPAAQAPLILGPPKTGKTALLGSIEVDREAG